MRMKEEKPQMMNQIKTEDRRKLQEEVHEEMLIKEEER